MRLHLTSIIPLIYGLLLVAMGLHFDVWSIQLFGWICVAWGFTSHAKNVAFLREELRQRCLSVCNVGNLGNVS